ncbi:hypothetical protein QAA18_11700 [Luteimonas sp. 8-5]|jgi:hypothetical protein|uniref:hypothetical protein n=1 Tax=Luteimonas sp. 8-5 TaxID=3039387 RepID=UPI00243666A1|nr:hypothetical protein [Luteimonas sp. 8-5]MDG6349388.1 hypothetical protein [Luteimonas sp. 8-5]
MKTALLISAAGLALFAFSPEAFAAKYKCGCHVNAKAGIEASSDPKMSCNETYSDFDDHVSIQESHLKIFVSDDNVVQGDKDMNIRFRPRDGKCLERVADGNEKKVIWEGAYCNNDSYKDLGQFKMKEKDGKWTATFEAKTGGKDYTGFAMFAVNQQDGKKYMQAVCLEDK